MSRSVWPFVLGALALGLGGCGPKSKQEPPPKPAAAPASAPQLGLAPSWRLHDLEGGWVDSEQFRGKLVVLDFWATWCGPCRQEIPGYVELQKKYASEGLVVIGVSLDEGGPAIVKKFVQKYGVSYQIVMGDDQITEAFGGIHAIPTTFIIGRDGRILDHKVGAVPRAAYEARLRKFLAAPAN